MNLSDIPPICQSSDWVTEVSCMLDKGHDGPHDSIYLAIRWANIGTQGRQP